MSFLKKFFNKNTVKTDETDKTNTSNNKPQILSTMNQLKMLSTDNKKLEKNVDYSKVNTLKKKAITNNQNFTNDQKNYQTIP